MAKKKRGKWLWAEDCFVCSVCRHTMRNHTLEIMTFQFGFCPFCGSEMEVEI